MSHRVSVLIVLASLALLIRLIGKGKFQKAWDAWKGPATNTGPSTTPAPDNSGNFPNVPPGPKIGDTPGWAPFGLTNITGTKYPTAYLGLDAGLIPGATKEVNYLLPSGSKEPVYLPADAKGKWQLLWEGMVPGVGGEQQWSDNQGGMLGFLHLSSLGNAHIGDQINAGQAVAYSGWPTSQAYSIGPPGPDNAHLAVVANKQGEQYIV